jgi:folate-binding protein YgfZ
MTQNKNTMIWRGAEVVSDYGDPEAEYQGLMNECVLVDRNERETYTATGKDVVQLLQGLVTGDVYTLAPPGAGMLTTLVNLKGRLVSDIRLLHILDMLIIDLEPGQTAAGVMAHVRHHVITEDAKFHDRRSTTGRLGVFGPKAADVLSVAGRFEKDLKTLPVYHGCLGRLGADEVVVQCVPTAGSRGFEIYLKDVANARVERVILRQGVLRCGHFAMERARIESGIPRFGVELDEDIIPLEADMNYAISYTKGCYLGQEIIARLDTRGVPAKMLRILEFSGNELPEQGAPVLHEGKEVGKIRSAAAGRDGHARAFAYLKRDHNTPGLEVEVGELHAQVRQVPGLVPEHWTH